MLVMSEPWDTCRGALLTGSGSSPRERQVAVEAEIWRVSWEAEANKSLWVQGCFEIAFANAINQKLFNLVSGRHFGQAVTFFIKTSQEQTLAHILNIDLLWNLLSQAPRVQITPSTTILYDLTRMTHKPHLKCSTAYSQVPKSTFLQTKARAGLTQQYPRPWFQLLYQHTHFL